MHNVKTWGLFLAFALVGIVSVAKAQQPGGPGGGRFGGFGGGFGGGNSLLDVVSREDVSKELELVDDQVTKLKEIRTKVDEARRERGRGAGGGGGGRNFGDLTEEERTKMAEERAAREKEVTAQVDEVLLPAQRTRAKQLRFQLMTQGAGFRGAQFALSRGEVSEELGIDDAQKEKLREAAEAAQKEVTEGTAKLNDSAKAKILDVLTSEQKAKWEKLNGEPFKFQQQQRQGGQGGRQGGRTPAAPGSI